MHGCMNTRKGKSKFKNLQILLYSGCSSKIVTGRLVENLHPEKDAMMQWHTNTGNSTTNPKVKLDFTLPTLSGTYFVTW